MTEQKLHESMKSDFQILYSDFFLKFFQIFQLSYLCVTQCEYFKAERTLQFTVKDKVGLC